MADVFISYSQITPEPTLALADELVRRGYTVWWDTELAGGERFTEVIMRELNAAKAVIVIWTSASIKSEFVEDEAGRAHKAGKLVPTKTADVSMDQLPLGFGRRHTIAADDFDSIVKAIEKMGVIPIAPAADDSALRSNIKRDHMRRWWLMGKGRLLRDDWAGAEEHFVWALALNTDGPRGEKKTSLVRLGLALALEMQGKTDEAIDHHMASMEWHADFAFSFSDDEEIRNTISSYSQLEWPED